MHLMLEVTLRGLIRHVDTIALGVVLPAVINAPEPLLLVASKEEGRAAMRAVRRDQTDFPGAVSEGDEVLSQQAYSHGRAIGCRDLLRQEGGDPEAAPQVSHGGSPIRTGNQLVFCFA